MQAYPQNRINQFRHWRTGLILLLLALLGSVSWAAAQEEAPITYQRYDVEMAVQPDGSIIVREIQQIRFDGQFTQAFAQIPLAYTTRIDDVQLFEGDTPLQRNGSGSGSFTTEYDSDTLYVDWTYSQTQPGDVRTFVLQYTVVGGLWVYPNGDILEWRAVPADRSGIAVEASRVTITLPPDPATGQPVPASALQAISFVQPADPVYSDGQVNFESLGAIPDGIPFQVQVVFPHGIVKALPQFWQIEMDSASLAYHYTSLDTEYTFNLDGSVDVVEHHRLVVDEGTLWQGVHTLTHTGMDDVTDVAVLEGTQPMTETVDLCDYCFSVTQTPRLPGWVNYDAQTDTVNVDEATAGSTIIQWTVPALVQGEETTFHLHYTLRNALGVSDESQFFQWNTVLDEAGVPVDTASIRLILPTGVDAAQVRVSGAAVQNQPDGSLLLTPIDPIINSAERWQWQMDLPARATGATRSEWQQEMESAQQAAQRAAAARARRQLLMGGLAVAILTLGLLGLLLAWYLRGRDEPTPLPAEYITEPPSDLAPGLVAYLLDERPTVQGVLASLFHLASFGLLSIRLAPEIAVRRNWDEKVQAGQLLRGPDGQNAALPAHLAMLFNNLRSIVGTDISKTLDNVAAPLQAILPQVYEQMGKEIGPLFDVLPDKVRDRWLGWGKIITLLGLLTFLFGCVTVRTFGSLAPAPGAALLLVGIVWMIASRWMPRHTPAGALEAAKWRAFRRYLLNLEDYGNQTEAQEILDRNFAYAVALDVAEVVLRDSERLQAQLPVWTRPMVVSNAGSSSNDWPDTSSVESSQTLSWQPAPSDARPRPAADGNDGHVPAGDQSLSGRSREIGTRLSLASLSLNRTLTAASGSGGSTMDAMRRAARSSSGGSSGTRYSGSSSSRSSSSSSSRSSSSSSSRSSSSRSSGGGGRRGFR